MLVFMNLPLASSSNGNLLVEDVEFYLSMNLDPHQLAQDALEELCESSREF